MVKKKPGWEYGRLISPAGALCIMMLVLFFLLISAEHQNAWPSAAASQSRSVWNASIMSFPTPSSIGPVFAPVSAGYYPYNLSSTSGRAAALRHWPCYGINKALLVYSTSNLSTPTFLNASIEAKLNKALPLVFTSTAILFNASNVSLASLPVSCRKIEQHMNRTYAQSFGIENITAQIGTDARLYKVVNLTPQGLAATYFSYNGTKPELSWYVASFVYKNVETNMGLFVFSQYANDTKVIGLARATFLRLLDKLQ